MTNGLYTTAVGMIPQMNKQEIIANNLANINTTGYKKDGAYFKQILQSNLYNRMDLGESELLPEVENLYTHFEQGPLVTTGNQMDVALVGKGFFTVQTPQGIAYTRNGNFTLDSEGMLVDNSGNPVLGENGPIELNPSESFEISEQGEIFIDGNRSNQFAVKNFAQPENLKKGGHNLLVPGNGELDEIPADSLQFKPGFLEQSNVNASEEMVEMILTLRRFEAMQKSLKLQDDSLKKAANDLGRVG